MRLSAAVVVLSSVLLIAACGGGGNNNGTPGGTYKITEVASDVANEINAESNLKNNGLEFDESHSSDGTPVYSWRSSAFTYSMHQSSRSSKIEALQTYVQAAQALLTKYANGPVTVIMQDGSSKQGSGMKPEKIYEYQSKISLCQNKITELQAGNPIDDGPRTAQRDHDYDDYDRPHMRPATPGNPDIFDHAND